MLSLIFAEILSKINDFLLVCHSSHYI